MNRTNFALLLVVIILVSLGLVMIYSSSSVYAKKQHGTAYYFLYKQLQWLIISVLVFVITYKVPYPKWQKFSRPLILSSIFLLLLTFSPIGVKINYAQRWIKVAGFSFQPSELCKLFLIIYIADFLCRKKGEMQSFFKGLCPPLLILSILMGLLLLQPDFGTAALFAFLTIILIFIGGGSPVYISSLFFLSLPALYGLIFHVGYRRRRILAFLDPYADPRGAGYHLIQALIAVGSGGVFGKGLGASRQKLFFLPSSYNDFIFSIIAEELGFIGATIIILLYLSFIFLGMCIAMKSKDDFAFLLASGIVFLIGIQAFVNIGVSIGLLPTKGLSLPFVSYGGSSVVVSIASVGVLLNIGKNQNKTGI